jgi:hypothetical protein
MDMNRLFGLLYVCHHYHSGQWSRLYRLGCRLEQHYGVGYGSSGFELSHRGEWSEARTWAAHYIRTVIRSQPNAAVFWQRGW